MRKISVTTLLVASLLSVVPAATADTRVPVFTDLPDGVSAVQASCDADHHPTGALEPAAYAQIGSDQHPSVLHNDYLEVTASPDRVFGLAVDLETSADLATLRVSAYRRPAMSLSLLTADGWLPPVHVGNSQHEPGVYGWYDFDASGSVADDLGPVTAFLWFGSCLDQSDSVEVDALAVGPVGDVTTYDFEGSSLRLEMAGASGAPGHARWTLYCSLNAQPDPFQGLVPVAGQRVVLESRPHGSGPFEVLGSARTSEYGQAAFHDRPRTLTDYRCHYDGNDGTVGTPYPAMVSRAFALKVPTHVTIHVRRAAHGRRVAVTGTADPRHPGVRVTLLAKGIAWDPESRVLARGRLSRRGTYTLSAPLGAGPWLVYARVAAAPGNAVGTSASREVT